MQRQLKPPSLSGLTFADRAFEWLEAAIIKGDLAPETKLPYQTFNCQQYAHGLQKNPIGGCP
jgi:hypothetical protein